MVILRSRSEASVRVAIMAERSTKPNQHRHKTPAGKADFTQQAVHYNAMRAIYPCPPELRGRRTASQRSAESFKTLPTPAKITSTTRLFTTGLIAVGGQTRVHNARQPADAAVSQSASVLPITLNVQTDTRNIRPKKTGKRGVFAVRILSMPDAALVLAALAALVHGCGNNALINVLPHVRSASLRSNPVSFSISSTLCSLNPARSDPDPTVRQRKTSPSMSLVAQNRLETPLYCARGLL